MNINLERISPNLHRRAKANAAFQDITLQEYISLAVLKKVTDDELRQRDILNVAEKKTTSGVTAKPLARPTATEEAQQRDVATKPVAGSHNKFPWPEGR